MAPPTTTRAYFERARRRIRRLLTPDQLRALKQYDSESIDHALRSSKLPRRIAATIRCLDSAFDACNNFTLPDDHIELFKGASPEQADAWRTGVWLQDPAYTSAYFQMSRALLSRATTHATTHATTRLLRMSFDPASPVRFLYSPAEREVVLERDVWFKVTGRHHHVCGEECMDAHESRREGSKGSEHDQPHFVGRRIVVVEVLVRKHRKRTAPR